MVLRSALRDRSFLFTCYSIPGSASIMHVKVSPQVRLTRLPSTFIAKEPTLCKAQQARIEALQAEVDKLQKTLG